MRKYLLLLLLAVLAIGWQFTRKPVVTIEVANSSQPSVDSQLSTIQSNTAEFSLVQQPADKYERLKTACPAELALISEEFLSSAGEVDQAVLSEAFINALATAWSLDISAVEAISQVFPFMGVLALYHDVHGDNVQLQHGRLCFAQMCVHPKGYCKDVGQGQLCLKNDGSSGGYGFDFRMPSELSDQLDQFACPAANTLKLLSEFVEDQVPDPYFKSELGQRKLAKLSSALGQIWDAGDIDNWEKNLPLEIKYQPLLRVFLEDWYEVTATVPYETVFDDGRVFSALYQLGIDYTSKKVCGNYSCAIRVENRLYTTVDLEMEDNGNSFRLHQNLEDLNEGVQLPAELVDCQRVLQGWPDFDDFINKNKEGTLPREAVPALYICARQDHPYQT